MVCIARLLSSADPEAKFTETGLVSSGSAFTAFSRSAVAEGELGLLRLLLGPSRRPRRGLLDEPEVERLGGRR
jgi:hypothetical protein